jgi:ectoine hydroxylase-related dioxygenase (phytanoyl-CoA dioxygenase family)
MDLGDKSVIVVGPAGYLENEDNTEYVNSFDVVCRPNVRIVDGRLSLPPNTGRRCDVVFHSGGWMGQRYDIGNGKMAMYGENDGICESLLRAYKDNGVKHILICSDWNLRIQNAVRVCNLVGLPYSVVTVPNQKFTTGLHGLCQIISEHPGKLAIKGFDFYQTDHRGYTGYYNGHNGDSSGHDHVESFDFFITTILPQVRLEIDYHLKKLIFDRCGYIVLHDVFDEDFLCECLKEIHPRDKRGQSIIDVENYPNTYSIKEYATIHKNLKNVLGTDDYRFCSHNDIGINRLTDWHKDRLNNKYREYETISPFETHEGKKHNIVKVCVYLQDHSKNMDALKVIPRSHTREDMFAFKTFIQLQPRLGDVIIFDQRLTHCGMQRHKDETRVLVTFGFGENNIFTDNFEKGTIARQTDQLKANRV